MTLENPIGWCDSTSGGMVIGCRGCELGDDCYAKNDTPARVLRAGNWPSYKGQKIETFGPNSQRIPTKKGLGELARLNKLCICDNCHTTYPVERLRSNFLECGKSDVGATQQDHRCTGRLRRIRFFTDSNSDWLDWPIEQLAQGLDAIRQAPNVDAILLTKWPELFEKRITDVCNYHQTEDDLKEWCLSWWRGVPPQNVWLLTSCLGNSLDRTRQAALAKIPAAILGLSCEPLWDRVSLPGSWKPAWVIVGCDSSKHHRGWEDYERNAQSLIEQCADAGVAVFVKQMPVNGRVSLNPDEWPEWARVQQFPQPCTT